MNHRRHVPHKLRATAAHGGPFCAPIAQRSRQGFTLIELLVVITIIVILLALLTPALDKAIYQTELAVCAANQHGLMQGTNSYAMSNSRRYPLHPLLRPDALAWKDRGDLRPTLRDFVSINSMFNDPLLDEVDLESTKSQTVWAGYEMWFGFATDGSNGITRFGQRLGINVDLNGDYVADQRMEFSALVADMHVALAGASPLASHPDDKGVLFTRKGQDVGTPVGGQTTYTQYQGPGADPLNFSAPSGVGPQDIGGVDRNIGFADGAVIRYNKTVYRVETGNMEDEAGVALYKLAANRHLPQR